MATNLSISHVLYENVDGRKIQNKFWPHVRTNFSGSKVGSWKVRYTRFLALSCEGREVKGRKAYHLMFSIISKQDSSNSKDDMRSHKKDLEIQKRELAY